MMTNKNDRKLFSHFIFRYIDRFTFFFIKSWLNVSSASWMTVHYMLQITGWYITYRLQLVLHPVNRNNYFENVHKRFQQLNLGNMILFKSQMLYTANILSHCHLSERSAAFLSLSPLISFILSLQFLLHSAIGKVCSITRLPN